MTKTDVLLAELELRFPNCTFSKRSKKIILHDGGYHDGVPAFDFNADGQPYECGIHSDIYEILLQRGFCAEWADGNVVHITEED